MTEPARKKPDIPEGVQAKWQRIVDLMARVLTVPSGGIMKVDPPQLEVFRTSLSEKNPFRKGERVDLWGLYCEKVIRQKAPLLVPDATKDPEWTHSPGAKSGMTYYLGYPLAWPDGEVFGTICVLDKKDNHRATQLRDLMAELQKVAERDLCLICEDREREDLSAELQLSRANFQKMAVEQIAELKKSHDFLEERLRFEYLVSELSSNFVNLPPDRVEAEIALALNQISRVFGNLECGLLEVIADSGQVRFLNLTLPEERKREFLNVDLARSHPWIYRRLVEEGGAVILSSLDMLPPEAIVDRATLEREGAKALFIFPLHVGGKVTHLIGLANLEENYEWPLSHVRWLRVLGEIFAKALINMRDQDALLRSERRLSEAQRIAGFGSWEWDVVSGDIYVSEEVCRIFGVLPQEVVPTFKSFFARVHADDRLAVEEALGKALADTQKEYAMEHRVVRPDGTERLVSSRGKAIFNQDRKPVRMIGAIQDITERRRKEKEMELALEENLRLKKQLEAENIFLRDEVELKEGPKDIIGNSDPMKYVMYRVHQVAPTDATVLLLGETGTGKGIFARLLHRQSARRDKPFVNVNCAGLPSNLIESELFGREKGAFTGSTARQIGRFELADGGTIFLDEIGEFPLELQAKMLKVIEEGEFERLGSPHTIKVDVRIVASTNRNLEEEIKKGRFRQDLYYRLSVYPITIPPLRERIED
ncbi:MAG: transcriptional regulator containing sigma 54 interaction domain, partial [Deltaproteobacteria bacterium]|nr:transcriptional regulator containing sigma 54 interaction domain [Deltaproteobacteria bacterium]